MKIENKKLKEFLIFISFLSILVLFFNFYFLSLETKTMYLKNENTNFKYSIEGNNIIKTIDISYLFFNTFKTFMFWFAILIITFAILYALSYLLGIDFSFSPLIITMIFVLLIHVIMLNNLNNELEITSNYISKVFGRNFTFEEIICRYNTIEKINCTIKVNSDVILNLTNSELIKNDK